ncbi:MAG: Zn-ribbon domain-containing OB-fold protein [Deltaproteobacteria bacterium]|nr:Zn-ribbon domain-containing OB-fold protein [Deltaproteobacteria bacterium]
MEKRAEYDVITDEVAIPYEVAYGPTWTRFFEGLKNEKIYGSKCEKCNRILVPARSYCPRCFVEIKNFIEVDQEGTVISWVLTEYEYFGMPTKPPFIGALIRLDGTDVNFLHLIGGFDLSDPDNVRKRVKNGMKVKALWNDDKKGTIMDIKYFTPVK